ncbi:MAG: PAS domain S-box protein, partial [Lentisphaerota bacterium]
MPPGEQQDRPKGRPDSLAEDLFVGGPTILFIWRAEANWPVEYVSPNISRFGYSAEDLIRGTIKYADMIVPEDLPRVMEEVARFSRDGLKTFAQEYRICCKDGTIRWIYDFTKILRNPANQITHYHGYIQDTTIQKQAEQGLKESQAQYEAIVNAFEGIVYICSEDFTVEFANQRLIERTGYNPVGMKCYKALHERNEICPWCVNDSVFRGKPVRWEVQSPKDDRWYFVVNTPINRADGRRSKMAMIQDITDRKQAEEILRRRDAILETVGFAAEQFLKSASWKQSIQEFLARLAKAIQVNRCYLFEDYSDPQGHVCSSLRYEWASASSSKQLYNPLLQQFDFVAQGFERWLKTLTQGHIISGHVRDFPEAERPLLASFGVRSALIVPIFAGRERWGFMGFDETTREREWSAIEMDTIKIAAGILGAAIQQSKDREELTKLTGAINQTADSVVITDRRGIIQYVNPAFEALTGYMRADVIGK